MCFIFLRIKCTDETYSFSASSVLTVRILNSMFNNSFTKKYNKELKMELDLYLKKRISELSKLNQIKTEISNKKFDLFSEYVTSKLNETLKFDNNPYIKITKLFEDLVKVEVNEVEEIFKKLKNDYKKYDEILEILKEEPIKILFEDHLEVLENHKEITKYYKEIYEDLVMKYKNVITSE